MDKSKNLIIIIVLLIIIIGGVSFFAFRQVQENKEMTELFAIEKEEMENEYTTFATQYDDSCFYKAIDIYLLYHHPNEKRLMFLGYLPMGHSDL